MGQPTGAAHGKGPAEAGSVPVLGPGLGSGSFFVFSGLRPPDSEPFIDSTKVPSDHEDD